MRNAFLVSQTSSKWGSNELDIEIKHAFHLGCTGSAITAQKKMLFIVRTGISSDQWEGVMEWPDSQTGSGCTHRLVICFVHNVSTSRRRAILSGSTQEVVLLS